MVKIKASSLDRVYEFLLKNFKEGNVLPLLKIALKLKISEDTVRRQVSALVKMKKVKKSERGVIISVK